MTALEVFQHGDTFVVSSETVAEGSGVEHRAVLQLIQNNIADFEDFGDLAFEMRDRPGVPGPSLRVALLNEQQATLLMTYQRNTEQVRAFKRALVKAFFDIARRPTVPQSLPDALRAYALEVEAREALEAKVAADAPKVEYIDTFVAPEDLRILRNVAKSLDLPEDTLRQALIDHKWIYEEITERWSNKKQQKEKVRRYSSYSDKRPYFRPIPNHDAPRFKGELMHTLKITPQGAVAISRAAKSWGLVEEVANV